MLSMTAPIAHARSWVRFIQGKRQLQSEQRRQGKGLGHLPLVGHDGMPRADQKQ